MLISIGVKAQSNDHVVSVVTPKKDTLYIYNDRTGKYIADVWKDTLKKDEKHPIIIMTNNTLSIRKRIYGK